MDRMARRLRAQLPCSSKLRQLLIDVPNPPAVEKHSTTHCELMIEPHRLGITGSGSENLAAPEHRPKPPVGTGPSTPSRDGVSTGPHSGNGVGPGPHGPAPIRSQARLPAGALPSSSANWKLPRFGSFTSR